jgi:hypothetical protein
MTARIAPESVSAWLIDRGIFAVAGDATPPRDPSDDDDEDEIEDGDVESDDEIEPAVIREPDE